MAGARRTPKTLRIGEWDEIKIRRSKGETWPQIADDYGMAGQTLAAAGRKKGIKAPPNTRRSKSILPDRRLQKEPAIREALAYVAKQTGETDPEKVVVACRDWVAEVADAVRERIVAERKYEGMPNLGTDAANTWGDEVMQAFVWQASEEEMGLRDFAGLVQAIGKLELERLNFHKAKMAASKNENTHGLSDSLESFLESITPSIGPPSERKKKKK